MHNSIYQSDITLRYNYLYDHVGRPLSVKLSVNNAKSTVLQAIEYNEIGDAVNTYLHNANPNAEGSGFCQKVKHEYNIRGWLSRINSVNNIGYDLFALDIKYQDPQLTNGLYTEKSYSGNISQLTYNLRNKTKFGYGFKYDDFDRLLNSNYAEGSNLDENVGKNNSNYSYDENGNIIYLQRFRSNTLIDRLYLNYGNGNMLKTVHDDGSVDGFIPTSGQFLYDLNGSLIYDPSKKISITNNFLNLPINIEFSPEDKISYGYSSVGVKEFKQVTSWHGANSLSVVDYCGSFVYKDKVLNCILTPFGRLVSVIVDSVNIWKTEYNLTDHLGNIGVVFAGHSSGQPEVMQQTTYYPFGYTLEQSNYYSLWSEMNKNLYNGKELQDDELGGVRLDWYDYGARMYDSQLGRWNSVDRFAEKYASLTPYHYAANNPIYYIDINGDSLWITHNTGFLGLGGTQTLLYENGNLYNKDGTAYTGKVKGFLSKSVNALNIISGTQEGGSMVGELQSSANNFTLVKGDSKFTASNATKAYANQIQTDPAQAGTFQALQNASVNLAGGSGGTISWNPSGATLPTLNGSGVNGTTDLAHEMFHGLDANRGLLDNRVDQGIERSEWQAVYRENVLRSQLGSPLRTHYIKTVDANENFLGGSGIRMLTPANQAILPNWYTP